MSEFPHNPEHLATCKRCGGEMVFNVPRMGAAGGHIHKSNYQFTCPPPLGPCGFYVDDPNILTGGLCANCGYNQHQHAGVSISVTPVPAPTINDLTCIHHNDSERIEAAQSPNRCPVCAVHKIKRLTEELEEIGKALGWAWGEIAQGWRYVGDVNLDDDTKNQKQTIAEAVRAACLPILNVK
jgi:hypothetical protein